jgi:copper chaperone
MQNINLSVPGMMCGHCDIAIKLALKDLNGVSNVNVDLENKIVSLGYNESLIKLDEVKNAIEDAGYIVK